MIPVAALSKAWVCGRSLAGIEGSNSIAAWMSVCCVFCVLSVREGLLRRADHSYRGVLTTVV